ncbi:MAG: alkaline phosphatase D family protein [Silvanigrellales bacterium]|nr:alkaline phosphatase D family protein [Silvanigrellales bacterium]
MHRRAFLQGLSDLGACHLAASLAATAGVLHSAHAATTAPDLPDECGVASGDPAAGAITLWTRVPLAARQQAMGQPSPARDGLEVLQVRWWLAERTQGRLRIVRTGSVPTSPARDWTVKVRVEGLNADTRYLYGFETDAGWRSVEGHTRTLPAAQADVEALTFAYLSCQFYGAGFYNVYEALAGDREVDFCVHLGDSIYENVSALQARFQVRPEPAGEATTLEQYRARYLLTLRDPWYREVRRLFAWIVLPDDHEVFNDYSGSVLAAEPAAAARKARAFQAYFEFMPLDDAPFPRLHRCFRFGTLATLFALDERQYRDGHVCASKPLKTLCDEAKDETRTMLGAHQKEWLTEELKASGTRWNVLLSEVMMMPQKVVDRPAGLVQDPREKELPRAPFSQDLYLTLDSFDGYPACREELATFLAERDEGNTLVWTGDIHNCYAGHVETRDGSRVAFEMSTGSVTSTGVGDVFRFGTARLLEKQFLRANPHMVCVDLRHHMYVRVRLGRDSARYETMCVDTILRSSHRAFCGHRMNVARGTLEVYL